MTVQNQPLLYRIHYVIGAFAVVTLLVAAYLRQEVVDVHKSTLVTAREWTDLSVVVDDLQVDILDVETVLTSPHPRTGQIDLSRLRVTMRKVTGRFHDTRRAARLSAATDLGPFLVSIEGGLQTLEKSERDLRLLQQSGDRGPMLHASLEMVQKVDALVAALAQLRKAIHERQSADLRRHERLAAELSNREWLVLLLIGFSLLLVSALSRTMAKAAKFARSEREVLITRLEEEEAALRSAIGDRDGALTRLHEQQTLLRRAERLAHVGSWRRNLRTGELTHSEEMARIVGVPEGTLLTRTLYLQSVHPEDREKVNTALDDAIAAGVPFRIEYRIARSESDVRTVQSEGHFETVDGDTIVTVIVQDITERREIERMKNEFISTVSHELRTPLTSIRGSLGLLASGRLGTLSEKGQRMLEIASANTDRLVRLINDILDIERMESGKTSLTRTRCNTADVVSQAVEAIQTLASGEGMQLESQAEPIWVLADGDRIIQVLTNLIGNAVKFSPAGSTVRVGAERHNREVVFSVTDEGRGIPEDHLKSVFEPFRQVDASDSRDKGGTGLGLTICRKIVEQHGGRLSVESTVGKGTTFRFTIPGAEPPVVAEDFPAIEGSRTIFVCDDDADTRTILGQYLVARGYTVRTMADGVDLITEAARQRPDAILLDLFMPRMNGWETLARLKANPLTADVPVIIASVLSTEETGESPLELSGWLKKPFDEKSLAEALSHVFQGSDRAPRLMLIEDDADLAQVISSSFERHGVEIIHASDGLQVLEIARQITPDLIVLDLMLPGMDGFGVVDWLKDHDTWRSIPMVVYSALEPTPSQRERLRLGPTEFLIKSRIPPEEFERRVMTLLEALVGKSSLEVRTA